MVQAADLWEGDNVAGRGRLRGPGLGPILVKREMCSALVMILKACRQHTAQVTLMEDDDVIETFAPDRADDALDIVARSGEERRSDELYGPFRGRQSIAAATLW